MAEAWNIKVYGIIQGVGFRPFVSRLAHAHGLSGTVCNQGSYVDIRLQGEQDRLVRFREELTSRAPKRSSIFRVETIPLEQPWDAKAFRIIEGRAEQGKAFVPPDIAICDACKEEMFDPQNRRFLHPFINCTDCGPRLTVLDAMPYDRERTSMGVFPMCASCREEYGQMGNRRYDAQPICCNDCGPKVYLLGTAIEGAEAITRTRQVIADGGIAAIKGIGGFHLCCSAYREDAIHRLRQRKHRPKKPFAVMARDLAVVQRECQVDRGQESILTGAQKPILLLLRKPGGRLCASIAPGNARLGIMLPYAPIHLLLFSYPDGTAMPDALIMTSGNPIGAPLCRTDEDAGQSLGGMCDIILSHNREIRLRADDSVMDLWQGRPYMLRRSRGYAPLPIIFPQGFHGQVLAVGGEEKNTFCLGWDDAFYLSPHIGDTSNPRTLLAMQEGIARMEKLLGIRPELVACDLHPRCHATQLAKEMGLRMFFVQHHYAHVLSCLAENGYGQPAIGVAFDGTGYGADGTIWGGEFLLVNAQGFARLGSIEPFPQSGGDASAREGWRIAVSLVYCLWGRDKAKTMEIAQKLCLCDEHAAQAQMFLADAGLNTVASTSAGRLFDAASAILGIRLQSTFEGEAAIALQCEAEAWERQCHAVAHHAIAPTPTLRMGADGRFLLPTGALMKSLVQRRLDGIGTAELAWCFHVGLAEQIVSGCRYIREQRHLHAVALSGGVFQNQLFLRLCAEKLRQEGFRVLVHSMVPPNDGGIALGQAVAAMRHEGRA